MRCPGIGFTSASCSATSTQNGVRLPGLRLARIEPGRRDRHIHREPHLAFGLGLRHPRTNPARRISRQRRRSRPRRASLHRLSLDFPRLHATGERPLAPRPLALDMISTVGCGPAVATASPLLQLYVFERRRPRKRIDLRRPGSSTPARSPSARIIPDRREAQRARAACSGFRPASRPASRDRFRSTASCTAHRYLAIRHTHKCRRSARSPPCGSRRCR